MVTRLLVVAILLVCLFCIRYAVQLASGHQWTWLNNAVIMVSLVVFAWSASLLFKRPKTR